MAEEESTNHFKEKRNKNDDEKDKDTSATEPEALPDPTIRRIKSLQFNYVGTGDTLNKTTSNSCQSSPAKSPPPPTAVIKPLVSLSQDTFFAKKITAPQITGSQSFHNHFQTTTLTLLSPIRTTNKVIKSLSREIGEGSSRNVGYHSDEEQNSPMHRSQSVSRLTRYTVDRYDDATFRWYRAGRTGQRRHSSLGDLFLAEEAGREVRILCRCNGGQRYLKRLVRGGQPCEKRIVALHVIMRQRPETLLFCRDMPLEQFRETLLGAMGAYPCDSIYLRNQAGNIVALTRDLEANTPSTAYTVFVEPAGSNGDQDGSGEGTSTGHRCLRRCQQPLPQILTRDHIACVGLLPNLEIERSPLTLFGKKDKKLLDCRRPSELHQHIVWQRFNDIREVELTDEDMAKMLTSDLDSYNYTDEKILAIMYKMFLNLNLLTKFSIGEKVLRNFLYEVYKHYNEVPFHNFRHCFCVAQMCYAICMRGKLWEVMGELNVLILFVSCICHDLDHPGYNNIYQINARTELALRYNDISPLENHHCSVAFRILQLHDCNIFRNFSSADFRLIRDGIIRCILATDMARHNEILSQFSEISGPVEKKNASHVNLLSMVLIKVADISNEVRPLPVAEPWLDRLLEEFFAQSDLEKLLGLPVTPFMDRDKVTKPSSQCAFIGYVLIPLFEALVKQFNSLDELLLAPAKAALEHYTKLKEQASKQRSMSVAVDSEASLASGSGPNGSLSVSDRSRSGAAPTLRNDDGSSAESEAQPSSPGSAFHGSGPELCPETEVEVSEKALKFKITTENSIERRSYPSSRKGSREAGLSSVELIRALHFSSSPSPPPLEVDENKDQELEQQPLIEEDIESISDQPLMTPTEIRPAVLPCVDAMIKGDMESTSEKTITKSPSSSLNSVPRTLMSRLRCFTDKMTFRDSSRNSPPQSPSRGRRSARDRNPSNI